MKRSLISVCVGGALVLAFGTASAAESGPTTAQLNGAAQDGTNWLYATHDYSGQRYSGLNQINRSNASRLQAVCLYRSSDAGPAQTNPVVFDGVMYLSIARSIVAIDAATCRERWKYTWEPKGNELSPTNRGVAIKDGKVIRGTADGYLIAVDARDGKLVWSRPIASSTGQQYLSMPPLIFEDMVIYGPAGADFGQKGWVGAFSLADGTERWRLPFIPDAGQPGAETWKDPEALKTGGGSLWTPITLDAAAGVLYVAVGNPAPDFYGDARLGDNLYTNSLLAIDVRSGKMLWYHQAVPHDVRDWDLTHAGPLFSTYAAGKQRKVIVASGKDGLLRLIDRDSHEVLYTVPITTHENVDVPLTAEGVRSCPGLLGGQEWNGSAYSPRRNTLFVPAVDWCTTFRKAAETPAFKREEHYYGGSITMDPFEKARGWLTAFDASTGKVRWRYASNTPMLAAVTTTAGDVVFTGDFNRDFLTLDAVTGKVLYRFNTGGEVGGGVVTYGVGGKQYVAAVSGYVSAFFKGSGPAAVTVFALP